MLFIESFLLQPFWLLYSWVAVFSQYASGEYRHLIGLLFNIQYNTILAVYNLFTLLLYFHYIFLIAKFLYLVTIYFSVTACFEVCVFHFLM